VSPDPQDGVEYEYPEGVQYEYPDGRGQARAHARVEQLWAALETRWPENRIEPTLARIAALTDLLGDPQRSYPVIHVTGTNGKSSTARMIESLLRSFGLRTGLFTSPHLIDPRERICFDGEPVSEERLLATWDEIAPYVGVVDANSLRDGGVALSYFEVLTALAYAAFADAPVDVAIVEVGVGGGWDSTNVADGVVSVITPIGLDHREYLGDGLVDIAREKAGIIKEGCFAVLAQQELPVAEVLLERCVVADATVAREGLEFGVAARTIAVGGQVVTLTGLNARYDDVFLPLFGEHQAHNAALALAAVEAFLRGVGPLDDDLVRAGLAAATSPGRLEVVRRSPTILLDAAHNPHGAKALARAIDDSFDFTSLVGVVGVLSDKDAAGLLIALESVLNVVVLTEPSSPRAMAAESLMVLAIEAFGEDRVFVEPSLAEALDRAVTLAEEGGELGGTGVLVTGSVVLVGDAKRLLS
jgi:dihydrofolate synthase/folylpolyglutamate synthase